MIRKLIDQECQIHSHSFAIGVSTIAMVIETDEKVPEMVVRFLKEYTGISRIIYYEKEAE